MKNIQEETQWYYDAVISDLVLRGMLYTKAKEAVDEYKLKEKLQKYPEGQLHYSISSTVNDMRKAGIVSVE